MKVKLRILWDLEPILHFHKDIVIIKIINKPERVILALSLSNPKMVRHTNLGGWEGIVFETYENVF